jgi:hypothetical protein
MNPANTGIRTDMRLATAVIATPAFIVDLDIRKKVVIKIRPAIRERVNHGLT